MARGSRQQKRDPIEKEKIRRKKLTRVRSDELELNSIQDPDKLLDGLLGEWVITIDEFVQEGGPVPYPQQQHLHQQRSPSKCTVFRVPDNMRELEKSAYTPKLVSIGPSHYNRPNLPPDVEQHKMRYLLNILTRFKEENRCIILDLYLKDQNPINREYTNTEKLVMVMKSLERETRKCYSETFDDFPSHDFVMMMLLDGCFVIELLRSYNKFFHGRQVKDPIFEARWMLPLLQRELFMLENQLPYFVLEKLFKLTSLDEKEPPLAELTLKFFDGLLPRKMELLKALFIEVAENPHDHLLGLFRSSFTHTIKKEQESSSSSESLGETDDNVTPQKDVTPQEEIRLVHAVTELLEAGVKFKKRNDRDLLDIAFVNGVFHIPPLIVDDYTIPLFLNLVAYEQCSSYRDPYFTDYVLFFDSLVNSPKDVEYLHYAGIVEHVLGNDEEVANVFSRLCREVVYDVNGCYLSKHLKEVNHYTVRKWNVWRAKLMHEYFGSPWTSLSVLAAIILLCLTISQTVFTILPYFKPAN